MVSIHVRQSDCIADIFLILGFVYRRQPVMSTIRGQLHGRGDATSGGYEPVGQDNVEV